MKTMKRIALAALAVLIVMAGCRKKVDVAFTTTTIGIAPEGAIVEVALTSNGDWSIVSYPEWLTVSPLSGNGDAMLVLTASVNDSDASLSGEIKATTKDNSAILTVTQEPRVKNFVSVSPIEKNIDFEGDTFEIEVTANCEWTVSVVADWLKCEPMSGNGNGIVLVTVEPVTGDISQRETNIFFDGAENELVSVHVTQYAQVHIPINISPDWMSFDYTGGEQLLSITCEGGWTASCDAEWITLGSNSGNGDTEIAVIVAENTVIMGARTANVNFSSETGVMAILVIKQDGAPDIHHLEVDPSSLDFDKDGGTVDITISCDEDWMVDISCDWVSLSAVSGSGDGVITLTVEPNSISEPRSTSFAVVSGTLSERVRVLQAAGGEQPQVSVEPDTLFAPYTGGLQHLSIRANTNWNLVSTNDWISFLTSSGTGDAELDIIVDGNYAEESRIATINIMHGFVAMDNVVVVQEGRPSILETDITEIQVGPEGGQYTIHVTANQAWSIETSVDWLSCIPSSGNNNGEFLVKITPMNSIQPRSTELRIYGSYGSMMSIPVTQSN